MAGEACFSVLTTPIPQYTKQFSSSCSFPAYLKTSLNTTFSARPVIVSASKSKSKSKSAVSTGFGKKLKKVSEEDAWESLFQQLEKDLENDTEDVGDEDITEEDMVNFERELDMVVRDLSSASSIDTADDLNNDDLNNVVRADSKDMLEQFDNGDDEEDNVFDDEDEENDEDFSDDDFEEPRKVSLQRWQLKKLAAAAELGRRKVNIKSLAAELQLDRDDVLYFLKSPPPELLMIAHEVDEDTSEDEEEEVYDEEDNHADETDESLVEKVSNVSQEASTTNDNFPFNDIKDTRKRNYGPRDWIKGKRLQKVHITTLERVYRRTKRPTNAMVESLVQVTNLPRRRILEWFEERRSISGTNDPPKHAATSRRPWKKPVTHTFASLE